MWQGFSRWWRCQWSSDWNVSLQCFLKLFMDGLVRNSSCLNASSHFWMFSSSTFCDLSPLSTFAHISFTFIYFKNYPLTTYDVSRTQKWMEWAPPNHYGACDLDSKIHDQMSTEVLCGYNLSKWYTYVYVHAYVHPSYLGKPRSSYYMLSIHKVLTVAATGWVEQLPLEGHTLHLSNTLVKATIWWKWKGTVLNYTSVLPIN